MGPQAENIFNQLNLSAENQAKFEPVIAALDAYFQPRSNVIFERTRLFKRTQKPGESAESFITAVYDLAENCGYDEIDKEENIRDRIVSGLLNEKVSKELQMKRDLTLPQAIETIRHYEMVETQMKQLKLNDSAEVNEARGSHHRGNQRGSRQGHRHNQRQDYRQGQQQQRRYQGRQTHQHQGSESKCMRCGGSHSRSFICAAAQAKCRVCQKIGHFAKVCRSRNQAPQHHQPQQQQKSASEITHDDEGYHIEGVFLDSIESSEKNIEEECNENDGNDTPWMVNIDINGNACQFKVDTGADVSIMSEENYNAMKNPPPMQESEVKVKAYRGTAEIMGKFQVNTKINFWVHVVKGRGSNLLSRKVSEKMNFVISNIHENNAYGLIKCRPVKITLKENATPYEIHTSRRIPAPLIPKVEAELEKMEKEGIIEKVTAPTDWCAPMVVVMKPSGQVRLCVDLKELNKNIKRERYMLPTIDDILPKLAECVLFSKLDAASGYWQLPLEESSAKLTTFMTHKGRFCFKRLPFGISSASEIFQREMTNILQDLEGVMAYQDDVIIFGKTEEEHNKCLEKVMRRVSEAGLKLNMKKCEMKKKSLKFLGHIISSEGIKPDEEKVKAIVALKAPENVSQLRSVLGMVQYLGRYLPNLSEETKPMSELLKSDVAWRWGEAQKKSFEKVKKLVTTTPVLAFYDHHKETYISADASSYGMGGYLSQKQSDGTIKPVAFCSRTFTPTEVRYAQIEKECLASTWVCERMSHYLTGLESFHLITDHKPLVPLINNRDISQTPLRCQRLLLRLMRFNARAEHHPGKSLVVSDLLSRSPMKLTQAEEIKAQEEDVAAHVEMIEASFPATASKLDQFRDATEIDPVLQQAIAYAVKGWPEHRSRVNTDLLPYYDARSSLSVSNKLLLYGSRIVIPSEMRKEVLEAIHEGHWGISKCRTRAAQSVWWPSISNDIKKRVTECPECTTNQPKQKTEPLIARPIPEYPWQQVAIDLFEVNGKNFIVQCDRYSRFIEVSHLATTTARAVILKIKNSFTKFGIAQEILTDNGPQFSSAEFKNFADAWGFIHTTNSPHYSQSNGAAESAVKIAEKIVQQEDPFKALLAYHASPVAATGISPAEALMGRKLRTSLITMPEKLIPVDVDHKKVKETDSKYKEKMTNHFNKRHNARPATDLHIGQRVRMRAGQQSDWSREGVVRERVAPRSYVIETPQGVTYRRNRKHLMPDNTSNAVPSAPDIPIMIPDEEDKDDVSTVPTPAKEHEPTPKSSPQLRRSKRIKKPVKKLNL